MTDRQSPLNHGPKDSSDRLSLPPRPLPLLEKYSPEYLTIHDIKPEALRQLLSRRDPMLAEIASGYFYRLIQRGTFVDFTSLTRELSSIAHRGSREQTARFRYENLSDVAALVARAPLSVRQSRTFFLGGRRRACEVHHSILIARSIDALTDSAVSLRRSDRNPRGVDCKVFLPPTRNSIQRWSQALRLFRTLHRLDPHAYGAERLREFSLIQQKFAQALPNAEQDDSEEMMSVELSKRVSVGIRTTQESDDRLLANDGKEPGATEPLPIPVMLVPESYECLQPSFKEQQELFTMLTLENKMHLRDWELFREAQAFSLQDGDLNYTQLHALSKRTRSTVPVEFVRSIRLEQGGLDHEISSGPDRQSEKRGPLPLFHPGELQSVTSDVSIGPLQTSLGPALVIYHSSPPPLDAVEVWTNDDEWDEEAEEQEDEADSPAHNDSDNPYSFEDWRPDGAQEEEREQEEDDEDITDYNDDDEPTVHSLEVAFFSSEDTEAEHRWNFVQDASDFLGAPLDLTMCEENVNTLTPEEKARVPESGVVFPNYRVRFVAQLPAALRRPPEGDTEG